LFYGILWNFLTNNFALAKFKTQRNPQLSYYKCLQFLGDFTAGTSWRAWARFHGRIRRWVFLFVKQQFFFSGSLQGCKHFLEKIGGSRSEFSSKTGTNT
jgi:hypothetical protein